jgi:hypothetical protein
MPHDKGAVPLKECSSCQRRKSRSSFYVRKSASDGLRSNCKQCMKERADAKKNEKAAYDKRRYEDTREQVLARVKDAYDPETKAAYDRARRPEVMARRRERYRTDVNYRLKCNLRSRLYGALKRGRKSAATMVLLGCSIEKLRQHLESLFTEGMRWAALMRGEIEVDHIVPVAAFDLTAPEQQRACFHYSNLQPLWKKDNRRKYAKVLHDADLTEG